MKKRIAMISYHTCPLASEEGKETGGMNVYVLESAKELVKRGIVVDIFTRSQDPHQPSIVSLSENLRVVHLAAGPQMTLHKKMILAYIPEFAESFLQFQEKEHLSYDLLHCHYFLSGLAALEIKNMLTTIPFIICFHTLALMKNLVARDELEREETERIDAELLLTKEADKVVATSQSDKEYLTYLYDVPPDKIAVIQPGVNKLLFRPIDKEVSRKHIGADLNDKIILFVGRIEPIKGIDALLYAMKIMLKRHPGMTACLWIVGGDISQEQHLWSKELQKLEQLRHLLNLASSVKFVGQQPQHELPYYYNASDLVVMPSHYESFGIAELEAMACGTPVITSNVTGIATLLDKNSQKLITTANNPLLLAKQMTDLLCDPKEKKAIGMSILSEVNHMQWKHTAAKTAKLYSKLTH